MDGALAFPSIVQHMLYWSNHYLAAYYNIRILRYAIAWPCSLFIAPAPVLSQEISFLAAVPGLLSSV